MSLNTLLIAFTIAGALLTIGMNQWIQKPKSWIISFLQHFCGVWFVFSGFVKAVDPMGTAFKMEQYFAAFQQTFEPTWFAFLAPLFPWMAQSAVGISIGMILLEILVGFALMLGFKPKLTAWVFFLLLVFFTLLTGFTYLTGYVPSNSNFFEFSAWGSYEKEQMRVSDCGCFGDFLKLDPKISFFKDLFLLIPGFIFLYWQKIQHQLWTPFRRVIIMLGVLLAGSAFCYYNTYMNEPVWDFRAFKAGADIRTTRKAELDAAQQQKIEFAALKNKTTRETLEVPYAVYMKEFKKYPKESWEVKFLYGETAVPKTKVSDFIILDVEGKEVTQDLLAEDKPMLMINAYKVYGMTIEEKTIIQDSVFTDSLYLVSADTVRIKKFSRTSSQEEIKSVFIPDSADASFFRNEINRLAHPLLDAGVKVVAVTGGLGSAQIKDFAAYTGARYPIYQADDILLKTMMRSNPGLLLWKEGKIIKKWHARHLPTMETVLALIK
ncbi:MAG: hypothetical protein SH818_17295 [Saprospiraceae bacterium]|nr:hypothetical protein [Saprospiraceae bacterium]